MRKSNDKNNTRVVIVSSDGNLYSKKPTTKYNNKDGQEIVVITEGKYDADYLKKVLANNLIHYMDKKGTNKYKISKDLKIKYSTINDWVNGRNYPRVDSIQKLADYFDISKSDLTEEKIDNKIPVLGRIPAGIPIEAIDDILDYEEIPLNWFNGNKQFFALRIQGDSMSPMYCTRRYCYF